MLNERSIVERLTERIVVTDGCWLWTGPHFTSGYARLTFKKTSRYAHRIAYEWFNTAVPDGYELDHLCRNRGCVNPDHLEPVTHAENLLRSPLIYPDKCKRGHPLGGDNVRRIGNQRHCRACDNEDHRDSRARLDRCQGIRHYGRPEHGTEAPCPAPARRVAIQGPFKGLMVCGDHGRGK